MSKHRITIVNHVETAMACQPSRVWTAIIDDVANGDGFARAGYRIDPLAEPALVLGGYRMWMESQAETDDRICRITERDDEAMRLSVHADYLSAQANGMVVYATYQAVPDAGGTLYRIDCHATLDLTIEADTTCADNARAIAALHAQFQTGIAGKATELKTRLEAARVEA